MALRSLLRLLPPSVPRMVPVHSFSSTVAPQFMKTGISPAAAARFMKTGSQVEAKTVAEQESIRVNNQHYKDFAQLEEAARQSVTEFSRAVDNLRKVGNASTFVIAAIPWIMIIGRNYQA